jgi:cytochrome c oxidase subunit IV
MGLSYEEGKKVVVKGLLLLAVVTIVEVLIALIGNGHIISGFHLPKIIMYPLMIGLSLYKAYFIVYEFMHMRYEVKGLAMSVLLPTLLLVWGVIAFLQEGSSWGNRRELIKSKNAIEVSDVKAPENTSDEEVKAVEQ